VRLYVLQHDCGHLSLFERRDWNIWAGYGLSTFTLTPFRAMQVNHNTHHAHLGNLEERESGEIHTMTLREWEEAGPLRRLGYRIYRNPLFLLPVGGAFAYLIRYRWPKNAGRIGWTGVMIHNALLVLWLALIWAGWGMTGLTVWLATAVTAGIIGVFLVYLQHNFEDTYWDRKPDLNIEQAALQGSSALDLGWWWDLGTCNIAYHDIHHFNPRIPSYRLRQCHRALRGPYALRTIEWPEAIRSFRLKLWDEDAGALVPFPPARQSRAASIAAE
jgi:omega-6 fatty acid desaturase (delta-12 desaturase)